MVVGAGRHRLVGGKEEGGRVSEGLGVGVGLGIECGPRRRGGVEGSKRVEWIGLEWGGRVTPLEGKLERIMAGKQSSRKNNIKRDRV